MRQLFKIRQAEIYFTNSEASFFSTSTTSKLFWVEDFFSAKIVDSLPFWRLENSDSGSKKWECRSLNHRQAHSKCSLHAIMLVFIYTGWFFFKWGKALRHQIFIMQFEDKPKLVYTCKLFDIWYSRKKKYFWPVLNSI